MTVVKIVKHLFFSVVIFVFAAVPAYAEVCDKVRPRWDPASGRVNQFKEAYFFFSSPIGLVLLAFIVVAFFFQKRWISFSCSVLLVLVAALLVADWYWLSQTPEGIAAIHRSARHEGCVASPVVTSIALCLLAAGLILIDFRKRRDA